MSTASNMHKHYQKYHKAYETILTILQTKTPKIKLLLCHIYAVNYYYYYYYYYYFRNNIKVTLSDQRRCRGTEQN